MQRDNGHHPIAAARPQPVAPASPTPEPIAAAEVQPTRADGPTTTVVQLSGGWLTFAWTLVAGALALAAGGFVNSFSAVRDAVEPSFGELAWTIPVLIDVGIAVFSGIDLLFTRLDMRLAWLRLVPWTLNGATIWLNVADEQTSIGVVAHAAPPVLWIVTVELAGHCLRARSGMETSADGHRSRGRMDRVRFTQWLMAPWSTRSRGDREDPTKQKRRHRRIRRVRGIVEEQAAVGHAQLVDGHLRVPAGHPEPAVRMAGVRAGYPDPGEPFDVGQRRVPEPVRGDTQLACPPDAALDTAPEALEPLGVDVTPPEALEPLGVDVTPIGAVKHPITSAGTDRTVGHQPLHQMSRHGLPAVLPVLLDKAQRAVRQHGVGEHEADHPTTPARRLPQELKDQVIELGIPRVRQQTKMDLPELPGRQRRAVRRRPSRKTDTSRRILRQLTSGHRPRIRGTDRQHGGSELLEQVEVLNVDRLATRVVSGAEGSSIKIIEGDQLKDLWNTRILELGIDHITPTFAIAEWEAVVLAQGLDSRDEYFQASRAGRGIRLDRRTRAQVWKIIEAATREMESTGQQTYLQVAAKAAGYLQQEPVKPYRHVIVDEAQDLHDAQWRLLRAAVSEGPDDLFIVGDAHQRIYGRRSSLSKVGINIVSRSRKLKINYRTTRQILHWSLAVLGETNYDDIDEGLDPHTNAGYHSFLDGATPTCAAFTTKGEMIDGLVDQVRRWIDQGVDEASIGVAARTRATFAKVEAELRKAGIAAYVLGPDLEANDGVALGTMHRMKGLEFRCVAVIDASAAELPLPYAVTPETEDPVQREADIRQERSLLYVAATRAREDLWLAWSGKPSRFLEPVLPR